MNESIIENHNVTLNEVQNNTQMIYSFSTELRNCRNILNSFKQKLSQTENVTFIQRMCSFIRINHSAILFQVPHVSSSTALKCTCVSEETEHTALGSSCAHLRLTELLTVWQATCWHMQLPGKHENVSTNVSRPRRQCWHQRNEIKTSMWKITVKIKTSHLKTTAGKQRCRRSLPQHTSTNKTFLIYGVKQWKPFLWRQSKKSWLKPR